MSDSLSHDRRGHLGEVARVFVTLGFLGFGGPAAHIAMMRDEVVRRRKWMNDDEFLESVGIMNLIPGPNSTELALHLGRRRAGRLGLFAAGLGFIVPAVLIVSTLAWLYQRFGTRPEVVDIRYGVLPVVVAVIVHALFGLARSAATSVFAMALASASCTVFLLGAHELAILLLAGFLSMAWGQRGRLGGGAVAVFIMPVIADQVVPRSVWRLFREFLEIGSVLYGSGYVLVAFLRSRFVEDLGWLTDQQVLDAIAVGQVTPGPVFTTATFIGWQLEGAVGAAVATLGIFAPSFLFVALLARLVPWVRSHAPVRDFVAGVTIASLGLMAGVLVQLVRVGIVDFVTAMVAIASLGLLVRTKLNSMVLVGGGALVGILNMVVV